jgi:hypothetical protein
MWPTLQIGAERAGKSQMSQKKRGEVGLSLPHSTPELLQSTQQHGGKSNTYGCKVNCCEQLVLDLDGNLEYPGQP